MKTKADAYRECVDWVAKYEAHHATHRTPEAKARLADGALHLDSVKTYETVAMMADVFGKDDGVVAQDVASRYAKVRVLPERTVAQARLVRESGTREDGSPLYQWGEGPSLSDDAPRVKRFVAQSYEQIAYECSVSPSGLHSPTIARVRPHVAHCEHCDSQVEETPEGWGFIGTWPTNAPDCRLCGDAFSNRRVEERRARDLDVCVGCAVERNLQLHEEDESDLSEARHERSLGDAFAGGFAENH